MPRQSRIHMLTTPATDEQGNRNNIVHSKPVTPAISPPTSKVSTPEVGVSSPQDQPKELRKDSTMDIGSSPLPIPLVVVEHTTDEEQPVYGHTAPDTPSTDADSHVEKDEDGPGQVELPRSDSIPLVVVEKTDDRPAYGDDFSEEATAVQRAAHDMRAADASPDKLIITPEESPHPSPEDSDEGNWDSSVAGQLGEGSSHPTMSDAASPSRGDEEQDAPLFRHESFQTEDQASTTTMDTIAEVPDQDSTDQPSSGDAIDTSDSGQAGEDDESDEDEEQMADGEEPEEDDDELDRAPLMSYETELSSQNGELDGDLLLPHEANDEDEDCVDEFSNGPLLSHETGLAGSTDDDEHDELDVAPLLPHETGFSSYKGSEISTNSDYTENDASEPRHYIYTDRGDDEGRSRATTWEPDETPTFTYENAEEDDEVPLLPHERDAAVEDSEASVDDGPFMLRGQPTFGYETDPAKELFGGSGRLGIFRTRTDSSSLPHRMPQTDAEDDDLNDPSLERFPTNRQQILDRVATISLHLPEDATVENPTHSPAMSVMSQACSSVDLAQVKSYVSLASVPEADDSDEEDDDLDSLSSPIVLNVKNSSGFARDPQVTPKVNDSKRLKPESESEDHGTHTADSSDAEGIDVTDGTKDTMLSKLQEVIATPNMLCNPEHKDASVCRDFAAAVSVPELRKRRVEQFEPSKSADITDNTTHAIAPSPNETFLQIFLRAVFGPVGRFFSACIGSRKRAG
jgi:hypothetical protein